MLYAAAYHPELGGLSQHLQLSFGYAPGIAALIYVLTIAPGWLTSIFVNRVAIPLGDASYSTYLLHGFVFWPFMRWQTEIIGAAGTVPTVLAIWLVIAAVSLGSYRFFELPAKRLTRSALDWSSQHRKDREVAAAS